MVIFSSSSRNDQDVRAKRENHAVGEIHSYKIKNSFSTEFIPTFVYVQHIQMSKLLGLLRETCILAEFDDKNVVKILGFSLPHIFISLHYSNSFSTWRISVSAS